MYQFDGQNRIISLDLGVNSFEVGDLYSRWKEWVATGDNGKYAKAFNTVGGEPINQDASQIISPYFFLANSWKLRPQEASHQLTIDGNLLTEDGTDPTIPTNGGFDVFVRTVLSVNSTTTSILSGSGLSIDQDAKLNQILDLLEADEEYGSVARKLKRGTNTDLIPPKAVTNGQIPNPPITIKQ